MNFDKVARGLIWASMGLGLAELVAPKQIQRLVGVRRGDYSWLIRLLGVRELMHGLMIFTQARPSQGVWSRVVGDTIDLGVLGAALTLPRTEKSRVAIAAASILGITALDTLTAVQVSRKQAEAQQYSVLSRRDLGGRAKNGVFHITKSITINRSPEELYRFWRNFENLPQFMHHLKEVHVVDEKRSHWVAKAPAGTQVDWEAEITDDRPNELIAWRSTEDADVRNSGVVRFERATGGRGTVVRVELDYRPPAGKVGKVVAKLFGEEPEQQIAGDLHRFKQVMELGEVVRSEGSPEGYGQKMQLPAQPVNEGRK